MEDNEFDEAKIETNSKWKTDVKYSKCGPMTE